MAYTPSTDLDGRQATLGSLRLGAVDSAGVAWFLQSLEGWDSPEIRSDFQEREADHGAWASPVYLGSRPVTLAGTVEAPDRASLDTALDQLYVAAGLGDTTLTVWESTPKQATVRRSGKLLAQHVTDRTATWSVMVTAADPRRYGTTLQTGTTGLPSTTGGLTFPVTFPVTFSATTVSGQINAVNVGSMDTRPVITITGPVVAPVVSALYPDGSVRQLIYSQDLATGDVLVIDTDAHTVVLNGVVSRRRFMTVSGGWPTIPAGGSLNYQFQSSTYNATTTLTASWRAAWM
ncbi:phage tail family protein [Streptomyces sp. NBC_00340]|uniref:phage distal tail protein n=1 Tax=Streptomyces sp. NBC_00340 TaxID=2975716 RepID=UPI00225876BD|nr:phage tail domain-containing protein [Streptomyces sp. NBC_00340]MCX5137573.1 phage tail family protein [Streptomyces sp. NBC_00340]